MPDVSKVIDSIDRRIIDELRANARMSWRVLGERVHLAPSSVAERVRKLEERGAIRAYVASVDPAALGRSVRAVVDVVLAAGADPSDFEAQLAARDEVALALYVTGKSDYTVIVDCAGADGLDAFVRWLRSETAAERTESKFVLRSVLA